MDLIRQCEQASIAVVPFGGGSSVVGGVEGKHREERRPTISLDTTQMNRLIELDSVSKTAVFQSGIWGPDLEATLQRRGYTLGHYPQSFEFSTLGGWIAARGAGQQSNRYGPANHWLVSARMATPQGELCTLGVPQSAAGPNLNELIVGSEGILGVITEAEVRVYSVPSRKDYRAYLFPSFDAGVSAMRELMQSEISVAMLRLSDFEETSFFGFVSVVASSPRKTRNAY